MSAQSPYDQPIIATQVLCDQHGNPLDYVVGATCTRIEIVELKGEYDYVPYVRVWNGNECLIEFSQHKATFIRFGPRP